MPICLTIDRVDYAGGALSPFPSSALCGGGPFHTDDILLSVLPRSNTAEICFTGVMRELDKETATAVVDSDGYITSASFLVAQLFGRDPTEIEGLPIEVFVAEQDREELWTAMTAAVENGEVDRAFDGWDASRMISFPVSLQIAADPEEGGVTITFTRRVGTPLCFRVFFLFLGGCGTRCRRGFPLLARLLCFSPFAVLTAWPPCLAQPDLDGGRHSRRQGQHPRLQRHRPANVW